MTVIKRAPGPTHTLEGVRFTSLATPSLGSADLSVWQADIDPGAVATLHRLTREEILIVVSGAARVTLDGQTSVAAQGDAVVVPADVDFGIEAADNGPLTLLCCLPSEGQAVVDGAAFTPPWAL